VERQSGFQPDDVTDVLTVNDVVDVMLLVHESSATSQEVCKPVRPVPLMATDKACAEVVGYHRGPHLLSCRVALQYSQ
jgi:hypothetical protein